MGGAPTPRLGCGPSREGVQPEGPPTLRNLGLPTSSRYIHWIKILSRNKNKTRASSGAARPQPPGTPSPEPGAARRALTVSSPKQWASSPLCARPGSRPSGKNVHVCRPFSLLRRQRLGSVAGSVWPGRRLRRRHLGRPGERRRPPEPGAPGPPPPGWDPRWDPPAGSPPVRRLHTPAPRWRHPAPVSPRRPLAPLAPLGGRGRGLTCRPS